MQHKRMPEKEGQIFCYKHLRYEDKDGFYVCASKERGFSNACKAGEAELKKERNARLRSIWNIDYNIFAPVKFM